MNERTKKWWQKEDDEICKDKTSNLIFCCYGKHNAESMKTKKNNGEGYLVFFL